MKNNNMDINALNLDLKLANISLREQFGRSLIELGNKYEDIVVLDADLSGSTRTSYFGDKFKSRFFNIGIAEQNMVGIATGLANSGKIAIVSGFACFTILRAYEFIKTAAIDNQSLKICATHSGLSASRDGETHQAIEDIGLISVLPNTKIFCPCDPKETAAMMEYLVSIPGVCYIRLTRNELPWVWKDKCHFIPNQANVIFESTNKIVDITIFSTGSMTCFTPAIAQRILERGISIRIVHFGMVKPLNIVQIIDLCKKSRLITTIEEHNVISGFGANISRVISENIPRPMLIIGINDKFGQSGSLMELYERYGISPQKITQKILDKFAKMKNEKNLNI